MINGITLTDSKQVAYLNMKGVQFKEFKREGNKKVFYYDNKEMVDKLITEYYNSDISRYMACYENIKTLIFRT